MNPINTQITILTKNKKKSSGEEFKIGYSKSDTLNNINVNKAEELILTQISGPSILVNPNLSQQNLISEVSNSKEANFEPK